MTLVFQTQKKRTKKHPSEWNQAKNRTGVTNQLVPSSGQQQEDQKTVPCCAAIILSDEH